MSCFASDRPPFRVVAGVDGTGRSDAVLAAAALVASAYERATVHAAYGIGFDRARDAASIERLAAKLDRASVRLELYLGRTRPRLAVGGDIVHPHVRAERPSSAILSVARDVEANLIVVGDHRPRRHATLLRRSTYERVLARATCSVIVVRQSTLVDAPPSDCLRFDPPCDDCANTREATSGAEWWCETHADSPTHRQSPFLPDNCATRRRAHAARLHPRRL